MAYLTMKQLLESGVHFGHQTKRWNPKMKPYIYGARNGIYIIDLQQTVRYFKEAYEYIKGVTAKGGQVLFIGTKKQAQNAIQEEARRCGMGFINNRWIGGFLTNFETVKKSINRLKELDDIENNPNYASFTKKELLMFGRERDRLEKYLGGVRDLNGVPTTLFIIDAKKEGIAIKEAKRLGLDVVAIVDTNCDPDDITYVIPGNDDAIRAIKLFSSAVADACLEGKAIYEESLQAKSDKKEKPEAAQAPVEAVPAVAPAAEPKAEPTAQPKAEPTAEPNAAPAAEPKAEPAKEPKAEPAAQPKAEPAKEPKAEPAAQPKAEEKPAEG
ncbi:MAG: 30S ribosomal protein S2 [Thermodesulfobacteriota bacterium]